MNREACRRYLEDPEANASHVAECAACRALSETLGDRIEASGLGPRASDALPLAAWEGASHRSWPLVALGAIVVGVLAALFCVATGTSPLELINSLPSPYVIVSTLRHVGASAPAVIALLFVIVNAILIALLRRAPRGIDV